MTGIPNHYKYEYLGDGKFAELNNEGKRPDRNGAVGQPANSKLTANQKKRLRKKNKKKSEKSTKGKELNEEDDDDDEEESEENDDKKPTAKSKQPASKSKILDDIDDNFSLLLTSMEDIKVDKGWVFTNISLKNASTIQIDPPVSKGIVKCEFLNIKDLKTVGISEDQIYYGRNQWPVDTCMFQLRLLN
ncbi:MAG: hypothetical protein EZS28_048170 [Streblomastix strix]|uniref:Uncharacterized protein n=1 Tax=Streblomastix strix TaxID=222440 RepID=A0A5J4TEU5_9EUKA|nr:MAG: hypothetical protein EZS28_048170 [Streblomastix strix]